jgi:hypothetical protein
VMWCMRKKNPPHSLHHAASARRDYRQMLRTLRTRPAKKHVPLNAA